MSTAWMLYWFTRLDAINGLLFAGVFICAATGAISLVMYFHSDGKDGKYWKKLFAGAICSAVLFVLTPTQKDVAIIAGGQLAVNVAQTPEAKELGNKVLQVINKELDGRIRDGGSQ